MTRLRKLVFWALLLAIGGLIGAMVLAPGASVQAQPRPTLTPTPEPVTPTPSPSPSGETQPPAASSPTPSGEQASPRTLPLTGPALLPVTGFGLTAAGVGIALGIAALAARRVRHRRSRGSQDDSGNRTSPAP